MRKICALIFAVVVTVLFAEADALNRNMPFGQKADIELYVNTRQAEMSMDRSLWNRIDNDRNRALARSKDALKKDMKDKDVMAALTFNLLSEKPARFQLDLAAIVSGGIEKEIELLKAMAADSENTITVNESKQSGKTVYSINGDLSDDGDKVSALLSSEGDNVFAALVFDGTQEDLKSLKLGSNSIDFTRDATFKENSFILCGKCDKIIALLRLLENNNREPMKILEQFNSIKILGKVLGKKLFVRFLLVPKDMMVAEKQHQNLKSFLERFSANMPGVLGDTSVAVADNTLFLSFSLDILLAWSFMMNFYNDSAYGDADNVED